MPIETFSRRDTSILSRWWWTVDRFTLTFLILLIVFGVLMSFAASPPVAQRLNLSPFYFVQRHIVVVVPCLFLLIAVSLLSPKHIRRLAVLMYLGCVGLMILTLFMGVEIKGARRWLNILGFSLQASEFAKPALAVMVAWMLSEKQRHPDFPGMISATVFLGVIVGLLMLQPDLGMTVVMVATWMIQIFIAGLPWFWVFTLGALGIGAFGLAYLFFPHVSRRIDQYLNPDQGSSTYEHYQVQQSLDAFSNGGFFGMGPGEGIVKKHIPDAHADFVFSVAGEEFGLILCLAVVTFFMIIVIRSVLRSLNENSLFVMLATVGLVLQFGLQAFVNMASSLHLIPTKGMTLPFISYGGSSMIALSIAMGMVLALTRRRQSLREVI